MHVWYYYYTVNSGWSKIHVRPVDRAGQSSVNGTEVFEN